MSTTLRETFLDELSDVYDAEKQLLKALPKMAKAATNPDLKSGFESHLTETKQHVSRLEEVFEAFGESAKAKPCKAMKGLLQEGEDLIKEEAGDSALICAAQKVEHYEIAAYGSLKSWAELLDEDESANLLEATLSEENAADEKLSDIADTVDAAASESEHAEARK